MARHDQRGKPLGTCPDCLKPMYASERTINLPVKINGRWHGVLVHQRCVDERA